MGFASSLFSKVKGAAVGVGRSTKNRVFKVGEALKSRYSGPLPGPTEFPGESWLTPESIFNRIEQDARNTARWSTNNMSSSPGWKLTTSLPRAMRNKNSLLRRGIRATGGSMQKHPLLWGAGVGAFGVVVGGVKGVQNGLADRGYPIETRTGMPVWGNGPGYQTWAKGRGRPMSSNHLGTQGLTLSLHKTRHR